VLQGVAPCCRVLQCVEVERCYKECCQQEMAVLQILMLLQNVAEYCRVLKCVVECCSALQCVAVCCSVLQCVAAGRYAKEPCQQELGVLHVMILFDCVAVCFIMLQSVAIC